jgi:hypothetical protein
MPRVVPSQVVATIDQLFPFAANPAGAGVQLFEGHAAHVAALLALVDQIPPELIALDAPHFTELTLSLAVMRNALDMWKAQVPGTALNIVPGHTLNPITLVRRALVQCPDQAPSPGTVELAFITDIALRESIRLRHQRGASGRRSRRLAAVERRSCARVLVARRFA